MDCILIFLILLTFFDSLKVVLIDMLAILTMSAKLITLGLFKRKVIWSKGYDIIISDQAKLYHVTQIVL